MYSPHCTSFCLVLVPIYPWMTTNASPNQSTFACYNNVVLWKTGYYNIIGSHKEIPGESKYNCATEQSAIKFAHRFLWHSSTFNFSQPRPSSVLTQESPGERQSFEIKGILSWNPFPTRAIVFRSCILENSLFLLSTVYSTWPTRIRGYLNARTICNHVAG